MRLPSASKLDLYDACDGPWHLDLPPTPEPEGAAATRGKEIHKHLELGTIPTGKGKADVEHALLAEADLPPTEPIEGVPERELVVYFNPFTGECGILGSFSEHPRESWPDRQHRMYGIADRVGRCGKLLLVSDLKTGSVEWLKMPWEGWQTKWLTAAIHRALQWEGNAYACIVSSECERAWCQEWTPLQLAGFLAHWSAKVDTRRERALYVTGEHCTFCPHRKFNCPVYAQAPASTEVL